VWSKQLGTPNLRSTSSIGHLENRACSFTHIRPQIMITRFDERRSLVLGESDWLSRHALIIY
jgi:hypothetical protein